VPKDSPSKNAADLTGKSLANPAIKDIGTVALDMWLMQQNVNPASVHILEMPQAVMSEALTRGTVAGALMIELAPRFIIAAYFARSDWAQTHAATVRAFAGAMA
jgi:ABC-type nitrate/sulfonate/bicarbonate transport system substrate-binding protein